MMSRYCRGLVCVLMAALLPAAVVAERVNPVDGVFYYQPAASVFGAEAAWINPAGLAAYRASGFQLLADYADDSFAKSWGWVANSERLATAYRRVDSPSGDDWQEYVFASAVKLGDLLHVGGSYRYYKTAPDYRARQHSWNLGFAFGSRNGFKMGAVFSNLNHARDSLGIGTETEMRYSLAYRPFGPKLTLAADMFLSTGTRLSHADYIYHARIDTERGIFIEAAIEPDDSWQVGLRFDLNRYFAGARSHFSSAGHDRTTVFVGATSLRQRSMIGEPARRLELGIGGALSENPPQPILGRERLSFTRMLLDIYRAAEDPSISEMVLGLRGSRLGFGRTQELRQALEQFQAEGKTITCHLSQAGNLDYYLASVCDRILIDPVSRLNLVGLKVELTFLGGTLDKLGAGVEMVQIGEHKSAAEKYSRADASEANRAQINRLLDDLYDQFVDGIAAARSLSPDSVRNIIDNGPFTSEEALAAGLVDGLSYRDDLAKDYLRPMTTISFRQYLSDTLLNDGWPTRPQVGVIVADGEIDNSDQQIPCVSQGDKITPGSMRKAVKQMASNPSVRGVILRVDSPGGLALAGEEMYHTLEKATRTRPLVVSMANQAASGGYYIAMPGKRIFADPATLTGSIGIFAGKPDLSRLYEKLDLGKELFVRGRYAGMMTWMRPFTDDERAKFASHIEAFYDHFVDLVATNRAMPYDSINALAQGQVWTGREALDNGLVDELGGLKQALQYTAERLDLDQYGVALYPEHRPWIELPGQSFLRPLAALVGLGHSANNIGTALMPFDEGIYARLPFDLTIE
ncbi:MAG: signal peptide peptidase SppA [bacterium]